MQYDKINLMFPTRGRSHSKLPRMLDTALSTARDPSRLRFTACVSRTDPDSAEVLRRMVPKGQLSLIQEQLNRPNLAVFFNRCYTETAFKDPGTLVSMFGDDMVFQSKAWDQKVLDVMTLFGGKALIFGDDCYCWHENLCVYFWTTRLIVDAMAPNQFMWEAMPVDGIDVVWRETARRLGIYIYLSSIKIYHDHATRGAKDQTYNRLRTQIEITREAALKQYDYADQCAALIRSKVELVPPPDTQVERGTALVTCFARTGDCVLASLCVNMAVEAGWKVDVLTLPRNAEVVRALSNATRVIPYAVTPDTEWTELSNEAVQRLYPGYEKYVNAQAGSYENHGQLMASPLDLAEWVRKHVADAIGFPCPPDSDWLQYRVENLTVPEDRFDSLPKERLAIIGPETKSYKTTLPGPELFRIHTDLTQQGYNVRILSPGPCDPRDGRYICGYTFLECIALLKRAELYVGADSALAWASIYGPNRKVIFHWRERIESAGVHYSRIHPKAEDVIVNQ